MTLAVAVLKDKTRIGYCALARLISSWFKITPKSLEHNQHLVREMWAQWADQQIVLGTLRSRQVAGRGISKKKLVKGVTLWIDSTDFRLEGRRKVRLIPFYCHSSHFIP